MSSRQKANTKNINILLDLIEQRFSLRLPLEVNHLRNVCEHYSIKREMILWEQGEANALQNKDYAKAVLISEIARLVLREIDPWPRRKRKKK